MTIKKKLNIGLFGFGVVGEGIYKVIEEAPSLGAHIKKVCIKDSSKQRNAPECLFTTDPNVLLEDPDLDVIVELIDDSDDAYSIVTRAIKNGKSVVSANKKLIAEHHEELVNLQQLNDVSFLYEAAVCGSIPVLRNLEEYYDNDLLNSVSGIVNGSTNFILSKMTEGLDYEEALKLAQDSGFAESDPSLDVQGKDAVNKLVILLKHAYGVHALPSQILHKGITSLHPEDSKYAIEKGFAIKLIANISCKEDGKIHANVLPTFVPSDSKFYDVDNEYNGILLGSSLADEQFLYGKGAGRYPTSSAVLSDISALKYGYRYEYKKTLRRSLNYEEQASIKDLCDEYFIRLFVSFGYDRDIPLSDFEQIEESYLGKTRKYVIGMIRADKLKKATWKDENGVSVVAFG